MTQQTKSFIKDWLQPIMIMAGVIVMGVTLQNNAGYQAKALEEIKATQKDNQKDINDIKLDVAVIKSKVNIK